MFKDLLHNSVDQEFNVLPSSRFSKHFVSMTSFSDVFFPLRWLSRLSSHLSLGLPLGLFPIVYIFITTLRVDSSSLLVTWPNHRSLFLSLTWTIGSILLCWYMSSFLFLSHLVTPFTILITFMSAVVICCSSLFVKVQHSLPKIRIGLNMVW